MVKERSGKQSKMFMKVSNSTINYRLTETLFINEGDSKKKGLTLTCTHKENQIIKTTSTQTPADKTDYSNLPRMFLFLLCKSDFRSLTHRYFKPRCQFLARLQMHNCCVTVRSAIPRSHNFNVSFTSSNSVSQSLSNTRNAVFFGHLLCLDALDTYILFSDTYRIN